MPLVIDSILYDRYKIIEILGQGGMGAVYKAEDTSLGVMVALKENFLQDEEALRQFRREAVILANMRQVNLPRVTDHFSIEDQGQYLVMDFIEGEDLRNRLERVGKLPEKEVVLLGIAICDALIYMHNLDPPILHRDIKPGNIKVTPQGFVFLVDFGLAKIAIGSQETTTGARGLTPGYSPPEQYGSARTDARSDVYSLGATLYTMLTGEPPEDGLAIAINQSKLTTVAERSPDTTPPVAALIEKALNVKPDDRYQTSSDFKQALLKASDTIERSVATGGVTIAPPPARSIGETIRNMEGGGSPDAETAISEKKPKKKRKGLRFLFNLIILIGAIGAGLYFGFDYIKEYLPSEVAELIKTSTPTVEPTDTPTQLPTNTQIVDALPTETIVPTDTPIPTNTPEPTPTPLGGGQGQIAFASQRTGKYQIHLYDIETGNIELLTNLDGGACQPDWNPTGGKLVFTSPCRNNSAESYPDATLYILDLTAENSEPKLLFEDEFNSYDPAWSPDGTMIAFTSLSEGGRPNVFTINLDTGEQINRTNAVVWDFTPSWSPDGEYIIFTSTRQGSAELWYTETDGGLWDIFSRSHPDFRNLDAVWSPNGEFVIYTQLKPGSPSWLMIASWDGGGPNRGYDEKRITENVAGMREVDFSSDGEWIVFTSNPDGPNNDIYIMRIDGTELTQLTSFSGFDADPSWRPVSPGP